MALTDKSSRFGAQGAGFKAQGAGLCKDRLPVDESDVADLVMDMTSGEYAPPRELVSHEGLLVLGEQGGYAGGVEFGGGERVGGRSAAVDSFLSVRNNLVAGGGDAGGGVEGGESCGVERDGRGGE